MVNVTVERKACNGRHRVNQGIKRPSLIKNVLISAVFQYYSECHNQRCPEEKQLTLKIVPPSSVDILLTGPAADLHFFREGVACGCTQNTLYHNRNSIMKLQH